MVAPKPEAGLAYAPIHQLAPRITRGELSPRELTAACLARIAKADPKLHAFVTVYEKEALLAAEASEKAIRAGQYLGPLHGIPIALKDLIELEGRITTGGARHWRQRVSAVTATAAQRLMQAGMILVGKTHMVEFAYGAWGTNAGMGAPWNPWDLATHRVPGGSSSGSGVAVAAGLVPAAMGSDTGGSVRIPASICGLVGLKTTAGRVSNHGVLLLSPTLDTLGPLTRSVEDAALVYRAIHGPDPHDPATQGVPHQDPLPTLRRGIRGLRLGLVRPADLEGLEGEMERLYREAARTLTGLGAHLEEIPAPQSFLSLQRQTGVLIGSEGYQVLRAVVEDEKAPLDPHVRARLLVGKGMAAADYIEVRRHLAQARAEMAEFMSDYDGLLSPTTPLPAIPLAEVDEGIVPYSRYTRAVNYLGLCALAVPMGLTAAGLPASLQIIGKAFDEAGVLRIGWAYEQVAGFADLHPDMAPLL